MREVIDEPGSASDREWLQAKAQERSGVARLNREIAGEQRRQHEQMSTTKYNERFANNEKGLVGLNYVWGGKDPIVDGGLDCSGAVQLGVESVPGVQDLPIMNADSLFEYTVPVISEPQPGDLRFLENDQGVKYHVQTLCDGGRVNATGGPLNTADNPGIGMIEFITAPLPNNGTIRRWDWSKLMQ